MCDFDVRGSLVIFTIGNFVFPLKAARNCLVDSDLSVKVSDFGTVLCNFMNCSTSGFPVLHHLPELAQTHVHCIGDVMQPSRPLSPCSPFAFNLSQHPGLFQ